MAHTHTHTPLLQDIVFSLEICGFAFALIANQTFSFSTTLLGKKKSLDFKLKLELSNRNL